uniref:Uncharacterized protein n=1 Tax=Anguilla anguilla TaxID=7936 RepID=A0A0E9R6B5_ANGAN
MMSPALPEWMIPLHWLNLHLKLAGFGLHLKF